ncbi:venom acid phosphatase Acph-1-like [Pogonomyrmex barbatus]|uniref:acid phosphatase n=1 Tax=Pogonomyrmex barbatus TaxID=144034 RepID=A0A6I9WMH7_9HYME|nr:venom acid phosphatase Acph-1-like [Pogonomyrmex barbatus]XP_011644163.1 venom acid phosphatase Acph-1-like [Pogonomyrmex barbatus]
MAGLRFISIILALCFYAHPSLATPDLKFVQVLFAHKLYAPWKDDAETNETSIPETLSYESFISATMNIPVNAEFDIYNFGTYLRQVYDEFLGDTYTDNIMRTRTTENTLSILSAQLVNAGLWPPKENQMWIEGLNWQPIPFDYVKLEEDTLLVGSLCPNFVSQMNQVLQTTETQKILMQYQSLFDYLSKVTERNISTPSDVALLYATLETMADRNEMLPNWAIDLFPDGVMYNVTLLEYDLLSASLLQKQLNGGTFLKEIIGNSLKYITDDIPKERKIMLYSGNVRNIVGVLKNLDLWSPHVPNEAALIFELYFDNNTNTYGMKINYYINEDVIVLSLPNCTKICPLQTLVNATFDLIPENSQSLCRWSESLSETKNSKETNESNSSYNGSISYHNKNLIFVLMLLFFAVLPF